MSIFDRPVHHQPQGDQHNHFGGGDMQSGKLHFGNIFGENNMHVGGSPGGIWNFGQSHEAANHKLQMGGFLPGLHLDGAGHQFSRGFGAHGLPQAFHFHPQAGHAHAGESHAHGHGHAHAHGRSHHPVQHVRGDSTARPQPASPVDHGAVRPVDSQASQAGSEKARKPGDKAAPTLAASPESAAAAKDHPIDPDTGKPFPTSLEQVRSTIGSSPAQHTKTENALAIGAAVVKEARAAGLDDKTAARLAERFVTAGLTETMTNKTDGSLNNREMSDYYKGMPTSFGFFQLHNGGQKSEDIVAGRYVKSPMSTEQAFTPNAATERSFHHFMQQHPNLNSDASIKAALIRSQAASDGRYQKKFDDHLPTAKKLLADAGFYKMLGSGDGPAVGDR